MWINNICDTIDLAKRLARQTGEIAVVSRYRGDWIVSIRKAHSSRFWCVSFRVA